MPTGHTRPGYDKPLYILPFDHRSSYILGMFALKPPLTAAQHAKVSDSKQLIYEGFKAALQQGVDPKAAGILVDEEFGAEILKDAARRGFLTAVSTERSGSEEFDFEYGDDFGAHLDAVKPTFAKALVRYNPEGDADMNARQTVRLKRLSDFCIERGLPFMFELLVPATDAQLASVGGDKEAFDVKLRPRLMRDAIERLQDEGVEPAIWKIEGLDTKEDAAMIVKAARRDGRDKVGCIVLGRGADAKKVVFWLTTAAAVPGFTGFAVGRTSFWDAVDGYEKRLLSREDAAARIGTQYREWVAAFESAAK
ncbi:myo-inositol catabolism protein IolC [Robbsia andropogonis]|uniref:2-deoxy-5-keto-D-gluconate 6-phosphate aldolase domain-containing protein n=1 Tax=Robbsia andropogonis TaxID=28092 RepID=UPI003D25B842